MALYALGDPSTADDVAQEAVTRALARADELREPAHTAAFVAGIARHIITDHIRARRRVEIDVDEVEIAQAHPDALALLMADEERAQLRAALLRLSAGDREVLRLSYEEGLGPAEVGERLSETSTVIRKRKSRALERLRANFHQISDPPHGRHKSTSEPTDKRSPPSYRGGNHVAAEL
jgi:RNA polymerase sigma-70 factor (ECF subfamily)